MHKSVRNLALVALLSLATAPAMMANPTGCDPKPKKPTGNTSVMQALQYTVLAYFGL